jgi:hypothetical protein
MAISLTSNQRVDLDEFEIGGSRLDRAVLERAIVALAAGDCGEYRICQRSAPSRFC